MGRQGFALACLYSKRADIAHLSSYHVDSSQSLNGGKEIEWVVNGDRRRNELDIGKRGLILEPVVVAVLTLLLYWGNRVGIRDKRLVFPGIFQPFGEENGEVICKKPFGRLFENDGTEDSVCPPK